MSVRRDADGKWRYRKVVRLPNGKKKRISGTPDLNTKLEAERAERRGIELAINPPSEEIPRRQTPTLKEWFLGEKEEGERPEGRFWIEWVIARKNSPSEMDAKKSIYRNHLGPALGELRLDDIDDAVVAQLKASLITKGLTEKTINNVLCVLASMLGYALTVKLLEKAPAVGLYKVESPEIEFYEFDQYASLLYAATEEGPRVAAGVALGGEAGLRVGEIKEVRWGVDIDMIARTVTVNRQTRLGRVGKPKGRRRRVVPMTDTLYTKLAALSYQHEALVFCKEDGEAYKDHEADWVMVRVCRRAGLPERRWHILRHTYATHSALLGVNPWLLQMRLGHSDIEQTMRYTHVAASRNRPLPPAVVAAGEPSSDPDRRILAMLAARASVPFEIIRGTEPAARRSPRLVSLTAWRRERVASGRCRDCGAARTGGTSTRCARCAAAERARAAIRNGKSVAKEAVETEQTALQT